MSNKKEYTVSRFPIRGIIYSLLIFCFFAALYALYHYWIWNHGSVWKYDKTHNDYFLVSMIGVFLSSWKCFFDIIVMLISIVAASVIVAQKRKSLFGIAKGKPIMWFYALLLLASIAGLIIINVKCSQRSKNHLSSQEYAFWYSVIFEFLIISFVQWITTVSRTCSSCGCFTLEYKSSASYEYESTHTYGGKYETRTAEVFDENHQKIGEIETKEYEPVKSYTTTNTATKTTYHCRHCGQEETR